MSQHCGVNLSLLVESHSRTRWLGKNLRPAGASPGGRAAGPDGTCCDHCQLQLKGKPKPSQLDVSSFASGPCHNLRIVQKLTTHLELHLSSCARAELIFSVSFNGRKKNNLTTLLELYVSSLCRDYTYLLCILQ